MKKNIIPLTILSSIFVIVFNVVFFVLMGVKNPASVWIGYAFVHVAYIALLLTKCFVPKNEDGDSFSYSLYTISAIYFALTLILTCVVMGYEKISYKFVLSANAVLLLLYVVLFIPHVLAGNKNTLRDQNVDYGKKVVDVACAKLEMLKIRYADNAEIFAKLGSVYDVIHSSPVKSSAESRVKDDAIITLVNSLEGVSADELPDMLNKLLTLVKERNLVLKSR